MAKLNLSTVTAVAVLELADQGGRISDDTRAKLVTALGQTAGGRDVGVDVPDADDDQDQDDERAPARASAASKGAK